MATVAIRPDYTGEMKDRVENFHGNQLFYIGWDKHLMFCAPLAFPLPPSMPFKAMVEQILPAGFGVHPDFAKIDWSQVTWLSSGQPFTPDFEKSLAENGLGHKAVLRFQTPGLNGIKGSCS